MTKRSKRLEGRVGKFLQQYSRKAQKGIEPNDRGYDRKLEASIRHMDPESLSEIISGNSELPREIEDKWFRSEEIPGVEYSLNQSIRIVKGKHAGDAAAVIALLQLEPEARYYIETENGEEIVILQSQVGGI